MKPSLKRKSDSCCSSPAAGTQWTQAKRVSLDIMQYSVSVDDLDLPEELKLANSQYFLMTENLNGKVLAFGEEVHKYPEQSRFVLRILNRNFCDNGKLMDYVELDIEEFQKIHSHTSEIEKKIKESKSREEIIDTDDLKVTVGPSYSYKPTVEISKAGKKSSMYIETFSKMINYLPEVTSNYSQFFTRHTEDMKAHEEIINALAFVRNEKRSNAHIRQPNVGRKNGLLTTCGKIIEQAKKVVSQKEE